MKNSLYEHSLPALKTGIAKSMECIAHIHLHFEIVYARRGISRVMIAGTAYTLHPGDCAIILPGLIHNHMNGDEGNTVFLAVCAPGFAGRYEETLKTNFAETPVISKKDIPKTAAYLLETLIELLGDNTSFTQYQYQITLSTFQLFFAYMLPLLHLRKREDTDSTNPTQHILEYIGQNSKRKLTLDIISKELGISKYIISKIFTTQLQINFNQYLNLLRINTAKKLLETTDLSITDICYESGFSAVRTFNTAFLKNTGFSPKSYRQKCLSGELRHKYDFYLESYPQ